MTARFQQPAMMAMESFSPRQISAALTLSGH
jgi:hypothetical protein